MTHTAVQPPRLAVSELTALLERQRDLYRQLQALAAEQGALVAGGDPEPLLALLAQRGRLVDELGRTSADLQPYRHQWDTFQAELADAQRPLVRGLLDEINSLRAAILAQDEEDSRRLAAARDQVGAELQRTATAGRALGAYRAAPQGAARFTDRHG